MNFLKEADLGETYIMYNGVDRTYCIDTLPFRNLNSDGYSSRLVGKCDGDNLSFVMRQMAIAMQLIRYFPAFELFLDNMGYTEAKDNIVSIDDLLVFTIPICHHLDGGIEPKDFRAKEINVGIDDKGNPRTGIIYEMDLSFTTKVIGHTYHSSCTLSFGCNLELIEHFCHLRILSHLIQDNPSFGEILLDDFHNPVEWMNYVKLYEKFQSEGDASSAFTQFLEA